MFIGIAYSCRKEDAWSCRGEGGERTSSIFLVFASVGLIILSREVGWLLRLLMWIVRSRRSAQNRREPKYATAHFYILATLLYASLIVLTLGPLYYFSVSSNYSIRDRWTPYLFGCLVGALTGDLFSAGLIAGLESWSITYDRDLVLDLKCLFGFASLVTLFVLHPAFSTLLAITGCSPFYLKYLKLVRWRWDYFSEATAKELEYNKILCRTSSQKPFHEE